VRQAVQRAVADKGRTIRIPVHRGDKLRKMARVYNELSAEREREPTDEEVATRLDWPVETVRDLKGSLWDATSLNQPIGSDADTSEVGELVEDERASEVAGEVVGEMELEWLSRAVEDLPERHRLVLLKRYGLGDGETATLAELSDELGISRERVRQVQREAERMLARGEYGKVLGAAA
jgi:RNA polymerase primary sigma factor